MVGETSLQISTEELTPGQRAVLEAVIRAGLASDFYLSGGTALRIAYLHHRPSLDLDFFSRSPVRAQAVLSGLRGAGIEVAEPSRVHDRWEFTARAACESVRVEFVHYAFDRVAPAGARIGPLEIDSKRDILANKLSTLVDRFEPKDYADTLLLLRSGTSLAQGVEDCRQKFGWPALEVLLQQAFARAGRLNEWPALVPPVSLADAKATYRDLARALIVLPEE